MHVIIFWIIENNKNFIFRSPTFYVATYHIYQDEVQKMRQINVNMELATLILSENNLSKIQKQTMELSSLI